MQDQVNIGSLTATNPKRTLLFSLASIVATLTRNLAAERKFQSDLAAHNDAVLDAAVDRLNRAVEERSPGQTSFVAETREGETPLLLLRDARSNRVHSSCYEDQLRRLENAVNDELEEGVVPRNLLEPVAEFATDNGTAAPDRFVEARVG